MHSSTDKYLIVIHHQTQISKNTRVSHLVHLSVYMMLLLFTFFTMFFSKVFAFTVFTISTRTLLFLVQVCQKSWSCFWLHDHDFSYVFCQNKPSLAQTDHQFSIHFGKIFQYHYGDFISKITPEIVLLPNNLIKFISTVLEGKIWYIEESEEIQKSRT